VLRFNRSHAEAKCEALERALDVPRGRLPAFIESLNEAIGLPPSLKAMGVTEEMIPRMVEGALKDHSTATNPKPVSREDFEQLFRNAIRGQ
jgi:alcohol dehydrogenase class IV